VGSAERRSFAWNRAIYYGNPADICSRWINAPRTTVQHLRIRNRQRQATAEYAASVVAVPLWLAEAPAREHVDLALIKDTTITEGKVIQFRAEALTRSITPTSRRRT
jgi:hypothetical protein